MKELDIEKLDRYMQRRKINPEGLKWHDPAGGIFKVEGLYWFDKEKRYNRFPSQLAPGHNEKVVTLARCTAGAQIRFRTDSNRILLSVRNTSSSAGVTMAETGCRGFDLYTGTPGKEIFWNTALPISGDESYIDEIFYTDKKEMREFRLNFPLYNGVQKLSIALEENAVLLPPSPLAVKSPVVIYGTSITQGGCASRPGTAFTNRLSRALQAEFLNFGFSGNGVNDPETAELLSTIEDPALFIIDSEANSISAELIQQRVPRFLDILRAKHPQTPILIVTKVPYGYRYIKTLPSLKEEFRKIYLERQAAGDSNIYFFDGSTFWDQDDTEHNVDGAHPNDSGFALMAQKLEPILRELLKKYGFLK
ncbi:MAG: SGNH/GDSL hydrolase family protein [Lentisphaeria bacterium]|nr:SGNH/GDSL hydrolase family protein [Lentisphaeria bacterium]